MSPALQVMCISEGPIFPSVSHGTTFSPLSQELLKTDVDGPFLTGSWRGGGCRAGYDVVQREVWSNTTNTSLNKNRCIDSKCKDCFMIFT